MRYKYQSSRPVHTDKDEIYVNSDEYFNDPDCVDSYESMGFDIQPVDIFGGFVPQDKSINNLKKNEKAIQERFGLEAGGED